MTPSEVRALLAELDRRLGVELARFWRTLAESDPTQFRALVIEAYPEIVTPYAATAAELGAEWYDSAPTTTTYRAVSAAPASVERLAKSAAWALNVGTAETALPLLNGSASRALFDGLRDTVVENVAAERGARWARHASANACGFCRMLATRTGSGKGSLYTSESAAIRVGGRGKDVASNFLPDGRRKRGGQAKGVRARGTQALGDKFHDNCHCIAVMVRPGSTYEPPSYVERWREEYNAARKQVGGNPNAIARYMDSR